MASERRRNALISGAGGAITGGTIGGLLGSVGNDHDTMNVLRDTKYYNKKKSAEFRALLSPQDQKSIKRAKRAAYAKSPMSAAKLGVKNFKRAAKLRRGSLIGVGIGAASVGTLSAIDGVTRPVHKSAFGIDHELSKSLTGRRGDKRNTKYALAAFGGATAGPSIVLPLAGGQRRINEAFASKEDAMENIIRRTMDSRGENETGRQTVRRIGGGLNGLRRELYSGASGKPFRILRAGRNATALAAVGGYAAYRKTDQSKKLRGVSKSEGETMTYSAFGVFHPEAQVAKALMPIAPGGEKPKASITPITGPGTGAQMSSAKRSAQATAALAAAPGQIKKQPGAPMPVAKRMMECVECGKKANCDRSGCCAHCAKIEKAFGLKPLKAFGAKAASGALNAGNKLTARGNSAFGLRAGHLGQAQQSVRRGAGRALTTMGKNPGKTAAVAGGTAVTAAAFKPKKQKYPY